MLRTAAAEREQCEECQRLKQRRLLTLNRTLNLTLTLTQLHAFSPPPLPMFAALRTFALFARARHNLCLKLVVLDSTEEEKGSVGDWCEIASQQVT